jgi:hypothetical protein
MCQEVTENSYLLSGLNLIRSVGLNSAFRNAGVSARYGWAERIRAPLYFHVISDLVRAAGGVRIIDISNQKNPYATGISKKYGTSSTVIPTGLVLMKNSFLSVSTG